MQICAKGLKIANFQEKGRPAYLFRGAILPNSVFQDNNKTYSTGVQAFTSMVISLYLTDPPPVVSFLPPPHCLISCKISTFNLSHSQPLFSWDSYLFPSACWTVKHWWKTAGMQTAVMWFVGGHLGCTACQRSSGIRGWLPPCPVTSLHDLCPHLRMDWCLRCLVV